MPLEPLRGFRDYLPPDAGARSELRRRMRAVARRAGFVELEVPSVEAQDLYAVKSGEEIVRQLWAFTDKGGRPVALAPESTPSVARIYVERAKSEPLPVKWFTASRLWRYEEPQAGRTREFLQFNLDILGVPGIEAEVDLLATASLLLDEIGAAGLYAFRLNDRELAEGLGRSLGARDLPRYFRALDRYLKSSAGDTDRELEASGLSPDAIRELRALIDRSTEPGVEPEAVLDEMEKRPLDPTTVEAIGRLRALFARARRAGIVGRLSIDPTIVRGFAYYTSTVFEAYAKEGEIRALFGGGRYDNLVQLFGGTATPACGLAIGDQTLELLLRGAGRWPDGEPPLDTYVVAVSAAEVPLVPEWVERLRRAGVSADGDLLGRSLSRQLREAARRRARRALILGPNELARGMVVERLMASGDQREIPLSDAVPPA